MTTLNTWICCLSFLTDRTCRRSSAFIFTTSSSHPACDIWEKPN